MASAQGHRGAGVLWVIVIATTSQRRIQQTETQRKYVLSTMYVTGDLSYSIHM